MFGRYGLANGPKGKIVEVATNSNGSTEPQIIAYSWFYIEQEKQTIQHYKAVNTITFHYNSVATLASVSIPDYLRLVY